jgi:hypothetical protein
MMLHAGAAVMNSERQRGGDNGQKMFPMCFPAQNRGKRADRPAFISFNSALAFVMCAVGDSNFGPAD